MITDPTNTSRVEFQGLTPQYDTWGNVLARPAPTSTYGTIAGEPVNWIGLVVDSGFAGTEQVQLAGVQINAGANTVTYTPGDVTSGGGPQTCAADTTDNFWLSISKTSGATPAGQINENLVDNTQGDTGGQFRLANGFYMYNLPLSQLTDLTATYTIGISPNSDGSNPVGQVSFGLK